VVATAVVVVAEDVVVVGVDACFEPPHATSSNGKAISRAWRDMTRRVGALD
jgi:hypothetical protein